MIANSVTYRGAIEEDLRGSRAGVPLAIVATGPSYDLVGRDAIEGTWVFAVDEAISEFQGRPNVVWVCHDSGRAVRGRMAEKIERDRLWTLVTRRACLPGAIGDVDWRAPYGMRMRAPNPLRIDPPAGSIVYWYGDFPDQTSHVRVVGGSLEAAIEVACFWGHDPIVLVGCDLGRAACRTHGLPWERLADPPAAAHAKQRRAIGTSFTRWRSSRILMGPSVWVDAPWPRIQTAEIRELFRGAGAGRPAAGGGLGDPREASGTSGGAACL